MYYAKPYYRKQVSPKSVFDLMDDFFTEPSFTRKFKLDIQELKDKYIVEAELPGVAKEDVSITFENDTLTIALRQEEVNEENEETVVEENNYVRKERFEFVSERRIILEDVDPQQLKASMKNGILTIELNKFEHKVNSYTISID